MVHRFTNKQTAGIVTQEPMCRAKHCIMHFRGIVAFVALTVLLTLVSIAKCAEVESYKGILESVYTKRSQLHSGAVEISGQWSRTNRTSPNELVTGKIWGRIAFDFPSDRMRFSFREDVLSTTGEVKSGVQQEYLFLVETSYRWEEGGSVIRGSRRDVLPHGARPFDPRIVGFGFPSFRIQGYKPLEELVEYYSNSEFVSMSERATDRVEFVSERAVPPVVARQTLVVDPRNMEVVKIELKWPSTTQPPFEWTNPPALEVETNYSQKSGEISLPARVVLIDRMGGDVRTSLDLVWESVNQKLPNDVFDIEHIGCPAGTKILAPDIQDSFKVVGSVGEAENIPLRASYSSSPRWWLIGINAVVVVVLAMILTFRYFFNRRVLR